MRKILLISSFILFFAASCIQDEALNGEADILAFDLPKEFVYASPVITNDRVILFANKDVDLEDVKASIVLSDGATISPDLESYDFSIDQNFTVTSMNGKYKKDYVVRMAKTNYNFGFEGWVMPSKYSYPQLPDPLWTSGNMGTNMVMGMGKGPFPTQETDDCVEGRSAAYMETIKGKVYNKKNYPLFSGSLFYGYFKPDLNDVPRSALFGHSYNEEGLKPIRFYGYYKYKPGPKYTNVDEEVLENVTDEFTLRAFLYQVRKGAQTVGLKDPGEDYLTGGDDPLTSDQIIAIADMEDKSPKEDFTKFDLSFKYIKDKATGKERVIDLEKYDYRFAIVFASSKRGDFFEGAIGSILIVDDVHVELGK